MLLNRWGPEGEFDYLLKINPFDFFYFPFHCAVYFTVLHPKKHVHSAGLLERTEYGFQVRAKTSQKWGEFTPPVYQMTGGEDPEAYPLPESAGTPAIVGRT